MARTAIAIGLLLVVLGLAFWAATGFAFVTSLIPAFLGAVIVLLGWIATNEARRMHAMHGVAMLALLGALAGFVRGLPGLFRWMSGGAAGVPVAAIEQVLMGLLCAALLVQCVRSFIAARRARSI